jgi:hypothetical protein
VRACVQFRSRESKAGNQHEQELNRERSKEYRHPALIVVQKHYMGTVGVSVSVSRVSRPAAGVTFVTGNVVSGGGGAVLSRPARKLAGLVRNC